MYTATSEFFILFILRTHTWQNDLIELTKCPVKYGQAEIPARVIRILFELTKF